MKQSTEDIKEQVQELFEQTYLRGYNAGYSKAENEISDAIEYLERANGNCDTDCKYCKYNNDCSSYKSRKMAIRSLEMWEKVLADIKETMLHYHDWGSIEFKAQHKEEAYKEILEYLERKLLEVTDDDGE